MFEAHKRTLCYGGDPDVDGGDAYVDGGDGGAGAVGRVAKNSISHINLNKFNLNI